MPKKKDSEQPANVSEQLPVVDEQLLVNDEQMVASDEPLVEKLAKVLSERDTCDCDAKHSLTVGNVQKISVASENSDLNKAWYADGNKVECVKAVRRKAAGR